jgi:uncharacterized Rmd1/YagE family protein
MPVHSYIAVAFAENFSLKELAQDYPEGVRSTRELRYRPASGGEVFLYPFGAAVFRDVSPPDRERELERLRKARRILSTQVLHEELSVRENKGESPSMVSGVLALDELTAARSSIVAHTVAQSAAMEYYERMVDEMFGRTRGVVERLASRGTVSTRTRPLVRFIGDAISVRAEVVAVLALLDKPDEVWEDPLMERIYADLRSEFDLADRYVSLELKLKTVQEALELVLDVARERRLLLLEVAVVVLIALELVLPFLRLR